MSVWQAKLFNQSALIVVPRTRSPHDFSTGTVANFGFKSGTRIIELLVSSSIPKFAQRSLRMLANFGIGTLAAPGIYHAGRHWLGPRSHRPRAHDILRGCQPVPD